MIVKEFHLLRVGQDYFCPTYGRVNPVAFAHMFMQDLKNKNVNLSFRDVT